MYRSQRILTDTCACLRCTRVTCVQTSLLCKKERKRNKQQNHQLIWQFVKLLIVKKRTPPLPISSQQVRKTSERSPLPATFAHCPHSSPETQYLTIDKQLTHLFFWGTRWLAPSSTLAALSQQGSQLRQRDNLVVKLQTAIKLLYFTIRNTDSWVTMILTLCIFFRNNSNFWHVPAMSSIRVNNPWHLQMDEKPLMQQKEERKWGER